MIRRTFAKTDHFTSVGNMIGFGKVVPMRLSSDMEWWCERPDSNRHAFYGVRT